MLQKQMFMRDQMTNSIASIMGEEKPKFMEKLEDILRYLSLVLGYNLPLTNRNHTLQLRHYTF